MKDHLVDGTGRGNNRNDKVPSRQDLGTEDAALPVRIDRKYIIDEIGSVLSFKKGLLFTIKELILRPRASVRSFLVQDRRKLVSPILYVIFCSFIYTILQRYLNFEDGYSQEIVDQQGSATLAIVQWIQGNYGYANILMSLLVVPWLQLFFRKHGYNYFEVLTMVLYIFGTVMLISALFGVLDVVVGIELFTVGGIVGFIYASWAFGQFFNSTRVWSYIKSLLAYVLGLMTSIVLAFIIGLLVDLLF